MRYVRLKKNLMKRVDKVTTNWQGYQLIDSGEGRKLEQFGALVLDRPDPQALWVKSDKHAWVLANAHFAWSDSGEKWKISKGTPLSWQMPYHDLNFALSFGKFKHIGVFPEHECQWQELQSVCTHQKGSRVLNLFGYTGAASLAAVAAGATVTHVDASKQTIATVKENLALSKLPHDSLRLVCEDALKYTKRLIQRGEKFEAIVMDPPAFGRGPKGEVWKIEEKLAELVALLPQLLSEDARYVLLNGYAAGFSARTFAEMLRDAIPGGDISYGDVGIQQKNSDRLLSTGIYAKWEA